MADFCQEEALERREKLSMAQEKPGLAREKIAENVNENEVYGEDARVFKLESLTLIKRAS